MSKAKEATPKAPAAEKRNSAQEKAQPQMKGAEPIAVAPAPAPAPQGAVQVAPSPQGATRMIAVIDLFDGHRQAIVPEGHAFDFYGEPLPREHIAVVAPPGTQQGYVYHPADAAMEEPPPWTTEGYGN